MFQSMNRILRWTKGYHRRLYLGSLCSFLATWAAAGPAMLTAWALGLVIESAQEGTALDARLPWLCLGGIILLIVLRFVCAYWKNRLQESIGTERAAQQRAAAHAQRQAAKAQRDAELKDRTINLDAARRARNEL